MTAKTFKVLVSPRAERDLKEAWHEIAQHDVVAADAFLDQIRETVDALTLMPRRGVARPDLLRGLRMLVLGKRLLFFRISGQTVQVVRVLHGARDLTRLFP